MAADPALMSFNVALGVLLVDILLSGDNAIVIALVCRSLSKEHRLKALWLGVLGAFLARVILTSCATLALSIPLIKLVGGVLLLKISIELIVDNAGGSHAGVDKPPSSQGDIFSAAKTIILADIVMSLDNVLALSAITQNNVHMLVAGLLLSIPILMFGSLYISRMLDVFPRLTWIGGGILGAVAGALIIEDPIFGSTFAPSTSTADVLVPLLAALFVVLQSKIIIENQSLLARRKRPGTLFAILRKPTPAATAVAGTSANASLLQSAITQGISSPERVETPVSLPTSVAGPAPRQPSKPLAQSSQKVEAPSASGTTKLLIGVAVGVMVVAGLGYYVLTSTLLPSPEGFKTYRCTNPPFEISYLPRATKIRFASRTGVVGTTVMDGRVVWKDYRSASISLGVPPPNNIVFADTTRLVVNGGMFENTECRVP